ncbi:peptidoglycan editing factor PgeF [Aquabacterium sp.]|uniref:peptidoglycan editing factor PgeF n=1 Tax=Aquabacterium sp. TaxID=1872578 RepID=UPI0035B033C3
MTTRAGGCSAGPYASMNLGEFVGDDPAAVAHNRARLAEQIGARAVFLQQVHGVRVVHVTAQDAWPGSATLHQADACVTAEPGLACVVQAADCLPVLFAAARGVAVGAAHAGWRGLAGGVLEQTLQAVCAAGRCQPAEVSAWLGACIGPDDFEVGADVLHAFGAPAVPGQSAPHFKAGAADRWWADLARLARQRLTQSGVKVVSGGTWPTHGSRFFSFRRDRGLTGRMGAAIWIRG